MPHEMESDRYLLAGRRPWHCGMHCRPAWIQLPTAGSRRASLALVGDYLYFGKTGVALESVTGWLAVPVIGSIGGLLGGLFSRGLILASQGFPGRIGGWIKAHPVVVALLCGFAIALCGLASGGSIFGTGYAQARSLLESGDGAVPHAFGLWKFAATFLSAASGVPGGIFSPCLATGAGLGFLFSPLFAGVPIAALVLLGMVSYFAGVVQAPLTAFVIVTEMTGDHAMIVPLMAAAFTAQACSRWVCHDGVYHALASRYRREAEQPSKVKGT